MTHKKCDEKFKSFWFPFSMNEFLLSSKFHSESQKEIAWDKIFEIWDNFRFAAISGKFRSISSRRAKILRNNIWASRINLEGVGFAIALIKFHHFYDFWHDLDGIRDFHVVQIPFPEWISNWLEMHCCEVADLWWPQSLAQERWTIEMYLLQMQNLRVLGSSCSE